MSWRVNGRARVGGKGGGVRGRREKLKRTEKQRNVAAGDIAKQKWRRSIARRERAIKKIAESEEGQPLTAVHKFIRRDISPR